MPIQIKKYDRDSLYTDTEKKLDWQAEAYYFDNHFKVNKGYNIDEVKRLVLLEEALGNCRNKIIDGK